MYGIVRVCVRHLTTISITRPNGVLERIAPIVPTTPTAAMNSPTIIIRTGTRVKVVVLAAIEKVFCPWPRDTAP